VSRYYFTKLGPTDRASVRVIERKRVTWGRKELGSTAPASFHTTDQKVRGSNPFGRTLGLKGNSKQQPLTTRTS
jgi:hypothetical protein